MNIKNKYVYIYLNSLKPGNFEYNSLKFDYEPFYVGLGSGNRYKMHKFNCNLKGKSHKINIIKKILNNKSEPIIIKLYEDLSSEEARLLEIETIKIIGRKDLKQGPLSNRTDGGDSSGYKHNKNNLVKSMHPIFCYDKNKILIKSYNSIQEASDDLDINSSNISQNCRYLINISHDKYIFIYQDSLKNESYKSKNVKYRIIRIDYNNNIKLYMNVKEASEDNNISSNTIVSVCKGRYLNGGDYLWRYKDYDESFYNDIECKYGFDINRVVIDNEGNKYINSLHASIKSEYKLYTICQNLNNNYKLSKSKFKYVN